MSESEWRTLQYAKQEHLLLGQVLRRQVRVQARHAAERPGEDGAADAPHVRVRVEVARGPAEPGLGALHGARAGASHPALQEAAAGQLSGEDGSETAEKPEGGSKNTW